MLWRIFWTMAVAGLSAVGGAWGTLAVAQAAWVGPGMLSPEQFAWAAGLGQLTPGPISVLVVAVGWQLAHLPGGAVALLGVTLPTWLVSVVAGRGLRTFRSALAPYGAGIPWVIAALAGTAGLKMVLPLSLQWYEAAGVAAAALAVVRFKAEPWRVMIAAAAIGGLASLGIQR